MKMKLIFLLVLLYGLTACGQKQLAEQPDTATQETVADVTDEVKNDSDQVNYIEDMVFSTESMTVKMPDEFEGKFRAIVDGEFVSIFDKECNEAGFGGYVFSVVVDKNKEFIPGGMYTKVGELETSEGERYNVCVGYPSEVQWDYTVYLDMPEEYKRLYDSMDDILRNIQGNHGAVFMYGAGTKGEDLYEDTVSRYINAVNEGWDANRFEEEGMSPEFGALVQAEGDKALEKIGFAYKDISNDGIDELMVGVIGGDESDTVYDIYTVVDGLPSLVVSGTSRNRYYALWYGGVANAYSLGAGESVIDVYIIEPGTADLYHQYSIKHDSYTDETNPWLVSYGVDQDSWEMISEEEYEEELERIAGNYLKIDYTPLADAGSVTFEAEK